MSEKQHSITPEIDHAHTVIHNRKANANTYDGTTNLTHAIMAVGRDLVAALERIQIAIDMHAEELGRQRA